MTSNEGKKKKKKKKERSSEGEKNANEERKKWREFLVKRGTLWEMKIICTFAERKIIVIITIKKNASRLVCY